MKNNRMSFERISSYSLFNSRTVRSRYILDGVLDLRHEEWSSHQTLKLNGEWWFYQGYFLMAAGGAQHVGGAGDNDSHAESVERRRRTGRFDVNTAVIACKFC
jgi:hypothetical protein